MPKFKSGDKISNGKIQYTVLGIQTNCLGDLCYVFKHPVKDDNFIWVSEEVDKSFELVQTDSDFFDWQSFRAEAAKDILCAMINHFGTKDIDMDDVRDAISNKIADFNHNHCFFCSNF